MNKYSYVLLLGLLSMFGCSTTASISDYNGVTVKEFDLDGKKALHVSGMPMGSAMRINEVALKKSHGDAYLYLYMDSSIFWRSKKLSGELNCSFWVDEDVNEIYFGDSRFVIWRRQ